MQPLDSAQWTRTGWLLIALFWALATPGPAAAEEELSATDKLLVVAQKICPVSGERLGSMGGPVKATVADRTVFLCCKGCFGKRIPQEHWQRMHENLIAAQGRCPVMGKPLPDQPASVVAGNRLVFVCCPPCTKKIEARPEQFLGKVDEFLREHVHASRESAK